ncbi:hypothetical protein QRD89_16535 [Halobacillus sp. ACCC02827]|uniref:hypothetical protein n=1 Tax=Bacillaceae TaxID=186817 RepID=UPI0002A4D260|nr:MULTISPECIES: hypothetical protein [Bacillaceae]ELK48753.1 hypothetical protein D479_01692 [Halobacillus sp. BAB-2008]WJE15311.1 hypothetical protein QRD89_16535 [Halobacillus sp. ACCC02827]
MAGTNDGKEEFMFHLGFAAFFLIFIILGWFTDMIELSSFSMIVAIALFFTNIYMFLKSRKEDKEKTPS